MKNYKALTSYNGNAKALNYQTRVALKRNNKPKSINGFMMVNHSDPKADEKLQNMTF